MIKAGTLFNRSYGKLLPIFGILLIAAALWIGDQRTSAQGDVPVSNDPQKAEPLPPGEELGIVPPLSQFLRERTIADPADPNRTMGGSCPVNYNAVQSAGTLTPATGASIQNCDDCTTLVNFPFPVRIYEQAFTTGRVSSNGNLQFVSNATFLSNTVLPAAGFDTTIFPFWDDLRTDGVGGGIFTSTTGTAPNRIFRIEWRAVRFGTTDPINFSIELTEGSANFDVFYGNSVGTYSGTIGVQRDTGSFFTNFAGPNAAPPASGNKVAFSTPCVTPFVTALKPSSGPEAGGTAVTIVGSGFLGGTIAVNFGASAATNIVVVNDTTITVTSPPGFGQVRVVVTRDGVESNRNNVFTYTPPPTGGSQQPAVMGTAGDGNLGIVFPDPAANLPSPVQNPITGLPTGAQPHGVDYFGADRGLLSDFGNSRVFVVNIATNSLIDTIATSGYNGTGTIAVSPTFGHALASGNSTSLKVITAPFNAGSAQNSVVLPGTIASFQTQAIVFNGAGRAFVLHSQGISVLDPPYTSIAFTIPIASNVGGALAITPNGNTLLVSGGFTAGVGETIRILNAPFSAASTATTLTIPAAEFLDGIRVTPDGSKALVVEGNSPRVFAISSPFTGSSVVQELPIPPGVADFAPGFEDIDISPDGQLAILTGNSAGGLGPPAAFIRGPFTAAGARSFAVNITGPGRGAGAVRFLPRSLSALLSVSKSAPATVNTGGTLTYTITYENTGALPATGVVIRDAVPSGTSFVSATNGGTLQSGTVVFNIGTVPANSGPQTVSFTVNVTATSGSITNSNYTLEGAGIQPFSGPPVVTTINVATAPGIQVEGNSVVIADGDSTPSLADHTEFPDTPAIFGGSHRTYTIRNTGTSNLTVSVSLSSGSCTQSARPEGSGPFTFGQLPTSPVSPSGTTTFQVLFGPTVVGLQTARVCIENNAGQVYDFLIQGNGTFTCVVDPVVQNANNSGAGSLRQAVIDACPGSTIRFAGNFNITLTSGQIDIEKNLTITGAAGGSPPQPERTITIGGNNNSRIFFIGLGPVRPEGEVELPPVTVTLERLTMKEGSGFNGGCIFNSSNSTLYIKNSTVTSCDSSYDNSMTRPGDKQSTSGRPDGSSQSGGGIYVDQFSALTMTDSTVSDNDTFGGYGGGIYTNGNLTVIRSTISGNRTNGGRGGGIYVGGQPSRPESPSGLNNIASLNMVNSTVSGNTTEPQNMEERPEGITGGRGGGIYLSFGAVTSIASSTITNNYSPDREGAGIYGFFFDRPEEGEFRPAASEAALFPILQNTIVADNTAGEPDVRGDFTSNGHNFIGDGSSGNGFGATGDQIGGGKSPVLDPLLGQLADNGGPTQTHAPLTDSPVIDKGSSAGLTTDQRSLTRPLDDPSIANAAGGNGSEIGAFEVQTVVQQTLVISGNIKRYFNGGPNVNLAGVTVTITGSLNSVATTDANGNYVFALPGPGGSYLITPSGFAFLYDPISRTYNNVNASVTNADFIAYNKAGEHILPRDVRAVNSVGTPGTPVTMPIETTSLGGEQRFEFTLQTDAAVLGTPTVACGAHTTGCTIVLNTTQAGRTGVRISNFTALAAGSRQIALVTFPTSFGAPPSTPVSFGDVPVARDIRNTDNNPVPAIWRTGFISFIVNLEADVLDENGATTGGDGVRANDVSLIRLFALRLATPVTTNNQYQRADCGPRDPATNTFGDANLNVSDVAVARLYALGLLPPTPAAGPTVAAVVPTGADPTDDAQAGARTIRVQNTLATRGQNITVPILIDAEGDESSASFSVNFNPAVLTYVSSSAGADAPAGSNLGLNTTAVGQGRLGMLIDAVNAYSPGTRQMISIVFSVNPTALDGVYPVTFSGNPVPQSVSSSMGSLLTTVYQTGNITLESQTLSVTVSGRVLTPEGQGVRNAPVRLIAGDGSVRTVTTSSFGVYTFENVLRDQAYTITVASKRYRFAPRIVTVSENLTNVDLIGLQ